MLLREEKTAHCSTGIRWAFGRLLMKKQREGARLAMKIYGLFNSKDIAEHCPKINHNKKLACLFASQLLYAAFGHIYHKSVLNSQTVLPLWTFVHTVQMNCGYWSDFRQIEELTFHIGRVKIFSNWILYIKAVTKNGQGDTHYREPMVGVNRCARPMILCLPSWKPQRFIT